MVFAHKTQICMIRHKRQGTTGTVLSVWLFSSSFGLPAASLDELQQRLESLELERLAELQQANVEPPLPFSTDGCSAGLSDGWRYVAAALPVFGETYGSVPPWEFCCVAHDRRYWRGAADDGYRLRKAADMQLKQCVIDAGKHAAKSLTEEMSPTPEEVRVAFSAAATLMYSAVRFGGRPCTLFSWRWGYGWPQCRLPFTKSTPVKP